jgi:hypothetical protein
VELRVGRVAPKKRDVDDWLRAVAGAALKMRDAQLRRIQERRLGRPNDTPDVP